MDYGLFRYIVDLDIDYDLSSVPCDTRIMVSSDHNVDGPATKTRALGFETHPLQGVGHEQQTRLCSVH